MRLPHARPAQNDDALQYVGLCQSSDSILIAASDGLAMHFKADTLRPQSRLGGGMRVGGWRGAGRKLSPMHASTPT